MPYAASHCACRLCWSIFCLSKIRNQPPYMRSSVGVMKPGSCGGYLGRFAMPTSTWPDSTICEARMAVLKLAKRTSALAT
jgi:hypothetical protein